MGCRLPGGLLLLGDPVPLVLEVLPDAVAEEALLPGFLRVVARPGRGEVVVLQVVSVKSQNHARNGVNWFGLG